jgi:hypothetical protein
LSTVIATGALNPTPEAVSVARTLNWRVPLPSLVVSRRRKPGTEACATGWPSARSSSFASVVLGLTEDAIEKSTPPTSRAPAAGARREGIGRRRVCTSRNTSCEELGATPCITSLSC